MIMKTKPVLLAILTLVIGFVIGMLTSAQLRYNKLKPVRFYFSEERFRDGFYRIIEPDEKQKAEIEKIIDKYAKHNSEVLLEFRKDFDSVMKAFQNELDSELTKEQLARLKDIESRRQEMIKENRKSREKDSAKMKDRNDFRERRRDWDDRPSRDSGYLSPPDKPPFPPRD